MNSTSTLAEGFSFSAFSLSNSFSRHLIFAPSDFRAVFISRRFQVIEFDRSNPMLKVALFVLMMVGVLILLTGFLGCCGAWKESTKMLFLVSTEGGLREY